jgi:hypothetical protein
MTVTPLGKNYLVSGVEAVDHEDGIYLATVAMSSTDLVSPLRVGTKVLVDTKPKWVGGGMYFAHMVDIVGMITD